MCGRYSLGLSLQKVKEKTGVQTIAGTYTPSYNIAPSQEAAVICNHAPDTLQFFRWGLIPNWAKDSKTGYKMINARAETIFEKASFRESIQDRRCLIPADSFYEWKQTGKSKQPYRISQEELIFFGGIWDEWLSDEGEIISTFSIITLQANRSMEEVHHRMPLILSKNQQKDWLRTEISMGELGELLMPFEQDMNIYPISDKVGNVQNNSPALHKPYFPPQQLTLL